MELFEAYPLPIRRVIAEVIRLEQEHISMERPRVKDSIKQIVDRAVPRET
jgi:hypothetical protein